MINSTMPSKERKGPLIPDSKKKEKKRELKTTDSYIENIVPVSRPGGKKERKKAALP